MSKPLRTLFVEDSIKDVLRITVELENSGYSTSSERVETADELAAALKERPWDIIFSAYNLIRFSAAEALEILDRSGLDIPFIIIGDQIGEVATVSIMKEGAHDYLFKDNLERLIPAIERELHDAEIRKNHREAEVELLVAKQNYHTSMDDSPLGIRIINSRGEITYANQAILDLLGFESLEDHRSADPADYFTPKTYTEHLKRIALREQGKAGHERYELEIIGKDGAIKYLSAYRKAIVWDGEVQSQILYQDITEYRQAEELYRNLAENSPFGVYIVQDGLFRYINPAFQSYTGYFSDELLGTRPIELVHKEDAQSVRDSAIEMLKGQRSLPYEFRVVHKEGHIIWAMETVSSINFLGKRAALGNFVDITERKQMEEQLLVTDRLASIGELSSGIAHELNNPLTSVIMLSDILLEEKSPDELKQKLTMINTEAHRAIDIVQNLLTFARKHPKEKKSVDINETIESVLKIHAYEQKVSNIRVVTCLPQDLPRVTADGFQLQQVFLNIIINAEYSMLEAHGEGTLTITTAWSENTITISFADDGAGIAKENIGHLFDPFFTTKEEGKGTGLGLSICYGIITEHGGKIFAESTPGEGSVFYIELPVHHNGDKENCN